MKIQKKDIFIFLILLLYVAGEILPRPISNLDEIWNFNYANCIANGLVPYKDFNMIQGALLPLICAFFMKIFGQEMLLMRFLAVVLDSIILIIFFKITEKIITKKYIRYLGLIILSYIMKSYFTIDYNWLALLIVLLIINLELKNEGKNLKYNFLIGVLVGMIITIKQTIGIVIVSATVGYKIFEIRNFIELKKYIKIVIFRTLGATIFPLIMIVLLILSHAFYDYIDYCILGISTFKNVISYADGLILNSKIIVKVLSIMPLIVYAIEVCFYVKNQNRENLILVIYGITQMILVYPISDEAHFVVAIPPTILGMLYIIDKICMKFNINKVAETIFTDFLEYIIIVIPIMYFLFGIMRYANQNINIELKHYKYLPLEKTSILSINQIDNYILGSEREVFILDATAAYYKIPIDYYHKNYDLFLKGNLGYEGEKGQIENLKKTDNKVVLIINDNYIRNWQNPEEVRKYIKTEMTKIGQIGIFDIYE